MRYFHRTSAPPDRVLAEADTTLGARLETTAQSDRTRTFRGSLGTLDLTVRPEGGHYTLVTVTTDQVTESELDKLAKTFLARVHTLADPAHAVRGAY